MEALQGRSLERDEFVAGLPGVRVEWKGYAQTLSRQRDGFLLHFASRSSRDLGASTAVARLDRSMALRLYSLRRDDEVVVRGALNELSDEYGAFIDGTGVERVSSAAEPAASASATED